MKKILFAICLGLLIGGAGCEPKTPPPLTTTNPVVQPVKLIEKQLTPAESFCEKQGQELIIRFNEEKGASESYCRFTGLTECLAEDYYQGKCGPDQATIITHLPGAVPASPFTTCGAEYAPVCGNNGYTYANGCLAQIQGIISAHTGPCLASEPEPAYSAPENQIADGNTGTINPASPSEPTWLQTVKDFILASPPSSPTAFLEKCNLSGQTLYYQGSCAGCTDVLYNNDGTVKCYPTHDFNGACPQQFGLATRTNYCTKIWQDKR